MMTANPALSLKDYQRFTNVWMPQSQGNQSLFLVRVPPDLQQMPLSNYLELMKLRVSWMFHQWIQTPSTSKEDLQAQLEQTLRQLHPSQEAPSLTDEDGAKTMWEWTSDWADSLLEFNETWLNLFRQTNPEIDFPVDLTGTPPLPNSVMMHLHNEVTLQQFLTELVTL